MANGTYRVPREFKDEDKWFRFFTKIQLLIVGIGVGICILLFIILSPFKLYIPALILSVIVMSLSGLLAFLPMPQNKYMYGGGFPIYKIVLRIVNKWLLSERVVYVKDCVEDKKV